MLYPPPYYYQPTEGQMSGIQIPDSMAAQGITIINNNQVIVDQYYRDPYNLRGYYNSGYYWDPYYYNPRGYQQPYRYYPRRYYNRGGGSGVPQPPAKNQPRDTDPRRPDYNNSPGSLNNINTGTSGSPEIIHKSPTASPKVEEKPSVQMIQGERGIRQIVYPETPKQEENPPNPNDNNQEEDKNDTRNRGRER